MTPVETCKVIAKEWWHLPREGREAIKRTYEKTYLVYFFWTESLATPTKRAGDRLRDLLHAIRAEGRRLGIPFFASPVAPL